MIPENQAFGNLQEFQPWLLDGMQQGMNSSPAEFRQQRIYAHNVKY